MGLTNIKNRIIAFNARHHYVLAFFVFGLAPAILFGPYILNFICRYLHIGSTTTPFLVQSDYLQQYVPFYEEFFRLAESNALGWSANEMFGISFYASKGYYLIGDVFAWLMFGFHQFLDSTIDILLVVTLLKLMLSGLSFDYLLKQINIRPSIRILYGLLYMFGGWMTIFIEQPVFISFYVVAPLLIASLIQTIKTNHPSVLLVISSALCICTQYYLCWMLCVLLLIFWCTYHWIHHTSFNQFIRLSFHTLSYFLIGVLISSIVWLPSILHMLNNPRLGQQELNTYWTYEIKDILNFIKNCFVPVLKYSEHSYRNYWYYFYQTGLYAGVFNIVVLPLFFSERNISKSTRKTIGITLVAILFTFLSPQLSKIFHFTYSLRYTYGIMVILLISGALWFNHIHSRSIKQISINGLILFLICLTVGVIIPYLDGSSLSIPDVKLSLVSCGLIIIYSLILILLSAKVKKSLLNMVLFILIAGESLIYGRYALNGQVQNASSFAAYLTNENKYTQTWQALKQQDSQFYRAQLVSSDLNDGLIYNIPTSTAYDSVYQYGLHDFLQWIRQYPDVSWSFNVDVPDLDSLLNVRYILLDNPTPEQIGYYKYWADEVEIDASLTVLKLKEPTSFARTVTSTKPDTITDEYLDETIPLNGLLVTMKDNILVQPEDYQRLQSYVSDQSILLQAKTITDSKWTIYTESLTKDTLVFVAQSYDDGWEFKDQNGQTIESLSIHGGFTGLIVPASTTSITATYHINGLVPAMVLTTVGIVINILLSIYHYKRRFAHYE